MHLLPLLIRAAQARSPGGTDGGDSTWAVGLDSGSGVPWAPLIFLVGPAVIAIGLSWWYLHIARRMRQAQLAPPVWLLPYLEPTSGGAPIWPPTESTPEVTADQVERTESVGRLARRKRAILLGLALNFVAGWAVAGVYLYESRRVTDFQELPATAFLDSSVDTLGYTGLEDRHDAIPGLPGPAQPPTGPVSADPAAGDSTQMRRREEQRLAFFRRRDSVSALRRTDSIEAARTEALRLRDSIARAVRDSISRAAPAAPPPLVIAAPPPAPPPPPPPPPDPGVEVGRAAATTRAAASDLVAGIATGQGLTVLLAPGAAREAFLRFVQQNSPSASLVSVADPVVTGDRATAVVTVQFQWRGTFGDTRRKTARFQGAAARSGEAWRATPFTVLDNLP